MTQDANKLKEFLRNLSEEDRKKLVSEIVTEIVVESRRIARRIMDLGGLNLTTPTGEMLIARKLQEAAVVGAVIAMEKVIGKVSVETAEATGEVVVREEDRGG
jgi:hypothetical protein